MEDGDRSENRARGEGESRRKYKCQMLIEQILIQFLNHFRAIANYSSTVTAESYTCSIAPMKVFVHVSYKGPVKQ